LLPTDPPSFEVDRLVVNGSVMQLAVVGPKGVAVLDLPRRWGKEGTFEGGKLTITCRCDTVLQVDWFVSYSQKVVWVTVYMTVRSFRRFGETLFLL